MFFDKLRSIIRLNLRFTAIAEVKRTELDLFESQHTYTDTDFRFVLNSSLRKVVFCVGLIPKDLRNSET